MWFFHFLSFTLKFYLNLIFDVLFLFSERSGEYTKASIVRCVGYTKCDPCRRASRGKSSACIGTLVASELLSGIAPLASQISLAGANHRLWFPPGGGALSWSCSFPFWSLVNVNTGCDTLFRNLSLLGNLAHGIIKCPASDSTSGCTREPGLRCNW